MEYPTPRVALISAEPVAAQFDSWSRYHSVAALLEAAVAQDVIVLNLSQADTTHALISLRQDSRYHFTLVYRLQSQASSHPLSDGIFPADIDELQQVFSVLTKRLAAFNRGRTPERLEERVMAWLWTRPNTEITAQRDVASAQVYSYPLLQAFAGGELVNEALWLRLMVEQGWLAEGQLINRVRHCLQCHSVRLNYVDVCPGCKDLDIARQPALHCFTCGHVAPQEQFLKEGLLLCPNCLTKLRHIGSDYDRPLENQSCRACRTSFMDAEVEARCLDCEHSQQPEELRVREVRNYRITEKGRMRCRVGLTEELVSPYFGRLNLISLEDFSMLLDWQIERKRP